MKFLSYYLPQFHRIPENDKWHGRGFTEWTKVTSASPLFEGHSQPKVPHADIGHYDLSNPETLAMQAKLMNRYGVDGQIFYHYWFRGKLLLEAPSQLLLSNPQIDMPFAFCWANENWTSNWSGGSGKVLQEQNYSASDDRAFIEYLIPFFQDDRYIKIGGRPLLLIYKTHEIPDIDSTVGMWAGICIENGVKPPFLLAVDTGEDPRIEHAGFQGKVERPLYRYSKLPIENKNNGDGKYGELRGPVYSYRDVLEHYMRNYSSSDFQQFPSVVVNWDVSPRHGRDALLLDEGSPELFRQWLLHASLSAKANLPASDQMVFINAWNEWAEGAYLEPDSQNGYSYLEAIEAVKREIQSL
jgi:lipopolysaccharide biosynthesis protein